MKEPEFRTQGIVAASLLLIITVLFSSCGYHIVGSTFLPFNSITIRPVINNTYEPNLEEKMHNALSNEFLNQGIEVKAEGGEFELQTVITTFALGAIGAVDETVKEQEIIMSVNVKLINGDSVTEYNDMSSPIKVTFQTTGTVSQSAANKDRAAEKACSEIAKEIVSRIIIEYAK